MHKNATKCNKTQSKWCKNKHGASKIIDTFETYQQPEEQLTLKMCFVDVYQEGSVAAAHSSVKELLLAHEL
jgi:hypothetical protein